MLKAFTLLSCVAVLFMVGATTASADYPGKVQRNFVKSCVKTAKQQPGISKAEARTYCKAALSCIEDKLTLKQFARLEKKGDVLKNKKVKSCAKKAAQQLG